MAPHRKFAILKWNNRDNVVSYNFHQYLIEGKFCDSTLSCEGKLIPVHRIMMASASKYFENIFEASAERQTVVLQEIAYDDLILIVKFAYTGEAKILLENYDRFIRTAKNLQIKGMVDGGPTLEQSASTLLSPAQPDTAGKTVGMPKNSMITLPTPPRESSAENSPNVSKNPFAVKPEPASPEPMPQRKPKDSEQNEKRSRELSETFSNPYDYEYEPPSKVKKVAPSKAAKTAAVKVDKKSTPKVKGPKKLPSIEKAPCRFCLKSYSVKSLYSHTISCKGNPDRSIHECPICHKQLSRADKLSNHVATHSKKGKNDSE